MMIAQNHGVYSVSLRLSMARTISRDTFSGDATSGPGKGSPAVIGVETKPGLIVRTCTPALNRRAFRPSQNAERAAFALPYR